MSNNFIIIDHKRVCEQIVDTITKQITSGELVFGQKLPSERELSEELGVSRTTLREALHILKNIGYIRSVKGSGNYVSTMTLEHAVTSFSAMARQSKQLVADFIEVRHHIDPYLAMLAAKNATKEQLSQINDAITLMREDVIQGGVGFVGDVKFHIEVAKASNNQAFAIMAEMYYGILSESHISTLNIPRPPIVTIEEHVRIYKAISIGDAERAADEMKAHIDYSEQSPNYAECC